MQVENKEKMDKDASVKDKKRGWGKALMTTALMSLPLVSFAANGVDSLGSDFVNDLKSGIQGPIGFAASLIAFVTGFIIFIRTMRPMFLLMGIVGAVAIHYAPDILSTLVGYSDTNQN